jgi:hypothetical protein
MSENEPTDRLGRIASAMLKAAEEHPESEDGDRAIIMLDNDKVGMVAHGGYDKDEAAEAFVNMLGHLQMLAEANGMQLSFVPIEKPGQG